MSNRIQVGELVLSEPRVYRRDYECAAWFQDVRVEPGRYPVFAYVESDGRLGHSLYAEAEGEVTAASFMALWAGVPIRDRNGRACDRGPEQVGTRAPAKIMLATYDLHPHVESGELELFDCIAHKAWQGTMPKWNERERAYVDQPHTFHSYNYSA